MKVPREEVFPFFRSISSTAGTQQKTTGETPDRSFITFAAR